jgi:nucleotidyltransferase/DNA polymerase involved in DNA repair
LTFCSFAGLKVKGEAVTAEAVVEQMRAEIFTATNGLTSSAGIAPLRRMAKICSEKRKPNGQFYVPPNRDEILAFMANLPIRKVPGIGKVSEQTLQALGVNVCEDLLQQRALLAKVASFKSI